MNKINKTLVSAMLGLSLAILAGSCKKGPAEKVGEKIDNAIQDSKDTARDIKDDVKKNY